MKLQLLNDNPSEPLRPWDLARRLEILLSLWRRPRDWQPTVANELPFSSSLAAHLWAEFVERSEPTEPVSTTNGLRAALQRHNANLTGTETPWSLERLEETGAARIIGTRVAIRSPLQGPGIMTHGDRSWRLSLQCDPNNSSELEAICLETFEIVERIAGELSVAGAHPVVPQVAGVLARLAFGVACPRDLVKLWEKAVALGVDTLWIGMLAPIQQRALAGALSTQLQSVTADLHWHTDLDLACFAEGQSYARGTSSYITRLDEMFAAKAALEQQRDSFAPKFVFGQMASAVALAGDASQVGNLLAALPPGRAHLSAVGTLQGQRPELLASLLAHPAWAPEAMFALAEWRDAHIVQGHGSMAMHDEWREVVDLARRLALYYDRGPDYPTVVAWAAHDEVRETVDTGRPFSRPVPSISIRMQPWRDRLESDEHAHHATDAMVARIGDSLADPDMIFALRLLPILEVPHPAEAARLARAIAGAYVERFAFSSRISRGAPKLGGHPELLECLERILRNHDELNWQRWCTPFDVSHFVQLSHEPLQYPITGGAVVPAYDVPRYIRSHANHLLAVAEVAPEPARGLLIECFVALFECTKGRVKRDPWHWTVDTHAESAPPLVRLGQVLQRLPEHVAKSLIARVEVANATELELAELLMGVVGCPSLVNVLEPWVSTRARLLLERENIALGEANHLSRALYYCGMFASAEQCALYALSLASRSPATHFDHLRNAAIETLLACWVSQKKWTEIDDFIPSVAGTDAQLLIENWRALAALGRGHTDKSLLMLRHVLRRSPKDVMALVNITAVHATRHEWSECVASCIHARNLLANETPAEVYSNEAQAHYQLRDFRQVVAALERLPTEKLRDPAMLVLRIALATTTAPMVSEVEDALRELEKTDPITADSMRARLAPLSQAAIGGASFTSYSLRREFVSLTLEERCTALLGQDLTTYILKAISSAAQRIVEQSALAVTLDEDQLTEILCLLLVPLEHLRIFAKVSAPGGWGPKKRGIADFVLSEMPLQQIEHGRRIARGEAKEWKGQAWMTKGLKQILATSNSGQELLLFLVVYCKTANFKKTVEGARRALARFGANSASEFATLDAPELIPLNSGSTQCIFKTNHGKRKNGETSRILYTILIDVRTEASRKVRHAKVRRAKPRHAKVRRAQSRHAKSRHAKVKRKKPLRRTRSRAANR